MRKYIASILLIVAVTWVMDSSWAMGLFRKRSGGGHSGSSAQSEHVGTFNSKSTSESPSEAPMNLGPSVLPDGDLSDPESVLGEVPEPSLSPFEPPKDDDRKLDFERSVTDSNTNGQEVYAVPEPLTLTMLGAGLAGAALLRRRRSI